VTWVRGNSKNFKEGKKGGINGRMTKKSRWKGAVKVETQRRDGKGKGRNRKVLPGGGGGGRRAVLGGGGGLQERTGCTLTLFPGTLVFQKGGKKR